MTVQANEAYSKDSFFLSRKIVMKSVLIKMVKREQSESTNIHSKYSINKTSIYYSQDYKILYRYLVTKFLKSYER